MPGQHSSKEMPFWAAALAWSQSEQSTLCDCTQTPHTAHTSRTCHTTEKRTRSIYPTHQFKQRGQKSGEHTDKNNGFPPVFNCTLALLSTENVTSPYITQLTLAILVLIRCSSCTMYSRPSLKNCSILGISWPRESMVKRKSCVGNTY